MLFSPQMEYDMWKEQQMLKCVQKAKTENNNQTFKTQSKPAAAKAATVSEH